MTDSIIVIDDNQEILDFVKRIFMNNFNVLQFTNAIAALECLERIPVRLIISDIMMPGMDGFELCSKIKGSSEYAHIPVILLTAKNTMMSRIEGLELGADAYIDKPFSPKHLIAQATNLINNRNTLKAFFASTPLSLVQHTGTSRTHEIFLEKINNLIMLNLSNPHLDAALLAGEMNMSRPTFYRKVRSLSPESLNELINLARLKNAAGLLLLDNYRISEVSNASGFSSPNHFTRIFQKHYGMSPRDFIKTHRPESTTE
ncbi:response regulator [Pedobacter psychrodurus]|uniref:response regulator n=1 Tax=Pedobacter psychrodurus TaxID=2530456 RepID=UPI002931E186|nr:response regulator [Pedobacter psychrodurus]